MTTAMKSCEQARNILLWVYTENWLFKNADDAFNHLRF